MESISPPAQYYLGFSTEREHGRKDKLQAVRVTIEMVELSIHDERELLNIALKDDPLYADLKASVIANLSRGEKVKIGISARR